MNINKTVKNIFGVAAAVVVLLGFRVVTENKAGVPVQENARVSVENVAPVTAAANKPVATLKDFNDAIVDIAEKTNPAVVTITTEKTKKVQVIDPFAQFFGMPFDQRGGGTKEYTQRGLGSGVIVSGDGYILTNNHVIDDTDKIKVILYSGDEVSAELVGTDRETDIAVLKINKKNLPSVALGNSDNLKVGSFVLAIGSPLSENLAHTVSFGIVSARGRSLNDLTPYGDYIQTDAAINPGNSGGALIDLNGELVGINSAIASRSGGNDGIGFAIPINLAKRIMEDLKDDGNVSRGYLGMYTGGEVDQTMAKALGLKDARGILVGQVIKDGPADKAGLKEQDIIISLNGKEIKSWDAFRTKIAGFKPGDKIELGINREGKEKTISVTLGERENDTIASVTPKAKSNIDERLGFKVTDLTSSIKRQLNVDDDVKGVVVTEAEESGNAYERGLRPKDVIVGVERHDIDSVKEFYDEIEKAVSKDDNVILLTVLRSGVKQFIAFEL